MIKNRPISCPLCGKKKPKSAFEKSGICYPCFDAREQAKIDADLAATNKALKTDKISLEKHANYEAQKLRLKADKELSSKNKLLETERARLDLLNKEQASIALARRSLLHYVERYKVGYDASWSHEDVARRIEDFVRGVELRQSPRLILQISSRFGKSLLASEAGPAWILGDHPTWNIVLGSYSDELPVAFSKQVRAQLRSPEYRTIFPRGAHVSPEDSGAKAWTTVEGGGFRATGVGGGLLGFGADVLIIDDPIKDMEQADSPGALEKVYDWFSSVAYSRLMPGAGILVIQQRMAHEDLVGRLEKRMEEEIEQVDTLYREEAEIRQNERATDELLEEADHIREEADELKQSMDVWDIATYPALATSDEYLTPEGNIIRQPDKVPPKEGWRLLRKKGAAIHPRRYTRNYYLKLKRANPRRFAAMYQLSPTVDEGAYFSNSSFQRYARNKLPNIKTMYPYAAWDLAIGTKQSNDHTVGIAGAMDYRGRLYLLERIRGKFGDIRDISDMIIDLHTRWSASITGIEKTHIEMAMGPILRTRMMERDEYIALAEGKEALKPIHDKQVRARTLQAMCQAGKVYVPDGEDWDEYINLMCRFGSSQVDDDVDATAWLAILANRTAAPPNPNAQHRAKIQAPRSWLDELIDEVSGSDGSYMAS